MLVIPLTKGETPHYAENYSLKDYDIIDISEYIKKGVITAICGRTRSAEPGEPQDRTILYENAALYKFKGENEWKYLEL